MSSSIPDHEAFVLWRTLRDKIIRGRHRIEDPHPVNSRDPNSGSWTFEQLCTALNIQPEFDSLLVKLRLRTTLPADLAARADALFTARAVERDNQRRLKAAEYHATKRLSKAAEFRAKLAAIQPVPLGGLPNKE